MNNQHTNWVRSRFVDQPQYRRWTKEMKEQRDRDERRQVKDHELGNAIAVCFTPEQAEWIASRLNLAAKLEQMTYDFATGKTDGRELVEFVHSNAQLNHEETTNTPRTQLQGEEGPEH